MMTGRRRKAPPPPPAAKQETAGAADQQQDRAPMSRYQKRKAGILVKRDRRKH